MLALDTETTGKDLRHAARPFFITLCPEDVSKQSWYEFDVDPYTRQPIYPQEDLNEIRNLLDVIGKWHGTEHEEEHKLVGQNAKFDVTSLASIGIDNWPWDMTHDTLIAGHLLYSNKPHNLTDMVIQYLGIDIEPFEISLGRAVKECRRIAKKSFPEWKIAKHGLLDDDGKQIMPSVKKSTQNKEDKIWKNDMWLPRAVAIERNLPKPAQDCNHVWAARTPGEWCRRCGGHRWWVALAEYSNADSAATVQLWPVMRDQIKGRGLWEWYVESMKLPSVIYRQIESRGICLSLGRKEKLRIKLRKESDTAAGTCKGIADKLGYDLTLPKSGNNGSLVKFCFEVLKLPVLKKGKSGGPSLDKFVLDEYEITLPEGSVQLDFIKSLRYKRKRDTALGFIESYERFMVPSPAFEGDTDTYHIFSSLNQTATDTLRMSMSNPNSQQISKGEDVNLRYLFGPAPGREWYPMDYENLELKIPGYEAPEPAMIALFERPDDFPYYGSYHLLNAGIVYESLFNDPTPVCPRCFNEGTCQKCPPKVPFNTIKQGFKLRYEASWYKRIKGSGFALIYGCQENKFDQTAGRAGGYELMKENLPNLFELADRWIAFANKNGFVETLPDKELMERGCYRGYPILCSRLEWGGTSPTVPLNYHIQSTAMHCTRKAMVRVDAFLQRLNRGEMFEGRVWRGGYWMPLQVHDELVPDCPIPPRKWLDGPGRNRPRWHYNWPVVRECKRLQEQSGDDIGIPLSVSVTYCPENWAHGEKIKEPSSGGVLAFA